MCVGRELLLRGLRALIAWVECVYVFVSEREREGESLSEWVGVSTSQCVGADTFNCVGRVLIGVGGEL